MNLSLEIFVEFQIQNTKAMQLCWGMKVKVFGFLRQGHDVNPLVDQIAANVTNFEEGFVESSEFFGEPLFVEINL